MRDSATFTVDDPRFSTGQVVGPSMLTLDGAGHDRHRDPFARAFRLDAVRERFTELVEAETAQLIDAIEPDGHAELRRGWRDRWLQPSSRGRSASEARTPPRCSAGTTRSSIR